ncbi:MAG: bifunctional UDP-N-acetylglucosamine diphosphorylase/glucosamine-1-phosphate N-acetyltransferase GlmU [Magnetococcus sp. DMHC-6]
MSAIAIVILAAGQGTRMHSQLPKVLHELAGKPLLAHVLDTCQELVPQKLVVVVGHGADQVRGAFESSVHAQHIDWVVQTPQLGTGHAVRCAYPTFADLDGDVIVLNGDHPLITGEILNDLLTEHRRENRALTLLSTTMDPPTGYGRVIRDSYNGLRAVVEEKDADAAMRKITEVNCGTYCFSIGALGALLERIRNENVQGEYYLPDVIALALADGLPIGVRHHEDSTLLAGINSRRHLAVMEREFRERQVARFMDQGVTFVDPATCWIAVDVAIGEDTVIEPQVILGPGTVIGAQCRIGPFCDIRASRLGAGTIVRGFCHLEGVESMGPNIIGPYARLRPGTHLAAEARVGNFVEIKKSTIGPGSKINHLSYIGDTQMGGGVNVGAGVITCNYDGVNKHCTEIGEDVFIGSDSQLVAPVRIGDRAIVGAGTTITHPVSADALVISRPAQKEIPGWSKRAKSRKQ